MHTAPDIGTTGQALAGWLGGGMLSYGYRLTFQARSYDCRVIVPDRPQRQSQHTRLNL
jgi:hypothetical protein